MTLTKTTFISKIIFWPLTVVSTIFTAVLFFEFAETVFTGCLWVVVGLSMESLKILFLARVGNALYIKRSVRWHDLVLYISFAVLSAVASLSFGISTIERQAIGVEAGDSRRVELSMKIKDAEERLARWAAPDAEGERVSIDRQIDSLTKQITNVTEHVSERSLQITHEIQRLRTARNNIGKGMDAQKDALITALAQMKRDHAIVSRGTLKAKGSFQTLADVLGVTVNSVMVCFLMFTVIAIEIGMAVTAGSATAGSPVVGKKKKKPNHQLSFTDMIEEKGNHESNP